MLRFRPRVSYYWFDTHVEAQTEMGLVKYQLIKAESEVDFTKYHVGIFENEYPFRV